MLSEAEGYISQTHAAWANMAMRDVMQLRLYVPCFHVRALRPSNIFPTVGVMENLLRYV